MSEIKYTFSNQKLIGSHLFPCTSCFTPTGDGSGLTLSGPRNIFSFIVRLLYGLLLLLELLLVLVVVVGTRLMVNLVVAVIIVYYYRFYHNVQCLYILGSGKHYSYLIINTDSSGVRPDLQSWSALWVCSLGLLSGSVFRGLFSGVSFQGSVSRGLLSGLLVFSLWGVVLDALLRESSGDPISQPFKGPGRLSH